MLGFGPYRTCTVFVSCSLRSARYTQTFLIPHGNHSSDFLVSSVHSLCSFTAETEGFEPSVAFKGHTSLAKRHVRPLRHVSSTIKISQFSWFYYRQSISPNPRSNRNLFALLKCLHPKKPL